jgi:SAM-dependent methyltransferase
VVGPDARITPPQIGQTREVPQVSSDPTVDTYGDPSHPTLLLAGVGDAEFCARLAAGARYVLRYHGESAVDPVAELLDGPALTGMHLVAPADQGELARQVVLARPNRVASLILVGAADPAADALVVDDALVVADALVVDDADPVPAILRHTSGGWDRQADRLATTAIDAGEPTVWFERLYSAARRGEVAMPWDRADPNRLLAAWTEGLVGAGLRALVIGCGLGADAEHIAGLGFTTDAFDVSESAIATARDRYPDSPVRYRTADLLDPPAELLGAFDLVVEIFTVQALPSTVRHTAIANVGRMVGPNGTLVAIGMAQDERDDPISGPPWPLSREEIESFASGELIQVQIADHRTPDDPGWFRWLAEFRHVSKAADDHGTAGTA